MHYALSTGGMPTTTDGLESSTHESLTILRRTNQKPQYIAANGQATERTEKNLAKVIPKKLTVQHLTLAWWPGGRSGQLHSPYILGCPKIFFLSKTFHQRMQNLRLKTPILEEYENKTEILKIHDDFFPKSTAVYQNSATNLV